MTAGVPSADTAQALIEGLVAAGLRHVCIAPGSRSGPLALAACRNAALETSVHLDERGAGFFAVGYAKASGMPAAVICTSGTAAANLLPAAVEARFSATPVVLVTADRPPELRDTGAWQTIEQTGLFGPNALWHAEVPAVASTGPDARRAARNLGARAVATALEASGPVHLNVPLREPLAGSTGHYSDEKGAGAVRTWCAKRTPPDPAIRELAHRITEAPRGLIVAGPMPPRDGVGEAIRELAAAAGYPLVADAASNARFPVIGDMPVPLIVAGAEAILRAGWGAGRAPDLVLRFGASPVWRPVNEYLAGAETVITVDPHGLWDDPDRRSTERVEADAESVARALAASLAGLTSNPAREAWREEWALAEGAAATAGAEAAGAASEATGARTSLWVVPALFAALPDGTQLWAANSMSVREIDSFGRSDRGTRVLTNRGAAGIDGTISAALGAARATGAPTVLLTGDLAFLHDLNGLLAAGEARSPVVIVVLNDGGGGIFAYLDSSTEPEFERVFRTAQPADLAAASTALGAAHSHARSPQDLAAAVARGFGSGGVTVVEVPLDFDANKVAHQAYWADVKARLAQAGPAF